MQHEEVRITISNTIVMESGWCKENCEQINLFRSLFLEKKTMTYFRFRFRNEISPAVVGKMFVSSLPTLLGIAPAPLLTLLSNSLGESPSAFPSRRRFCMTCARGTTDRETGS
jgi:hypothetical protein